MASIEGCKDIFANHSCLQEINKNFQHFIESVQRSYPPALLPADDSLRINEISFDFCYLFNGSTQEEQKQLLSNIDDVNQLWSFLSSHPTSYDCQRLMDELYQLAAKTLAVKQHLAYYINGFLLTLGISYDDMLRFSCFKLLGLLMNHPDPLNRETILHFNRLCYECLYDFHLYYEHIESFTIPSRIISINQKDVVDFLDGKIISCDLQKAVKQAIDELGGHVFFKMHRSPKDAYEVLNKEIKGQWTDIWKLKVDEDPRVYFMKVQSLDQIRLLLKTSDRLREDLQMMSSGGHLVLRQWIDSLSNEYRCFICHHQLNAISTYGNRIDPSLSKDQLFTWINSNPFQEILGHIPYSHAVVDCFIDPIKQRAIIIEINPFSQRSSAAQYSWVIDREILYNYYTVHGHVNMRLSE